MRTEDPLTEPDFYYEGEKAAVGFGKTMQSLTSELVTVEVETTFGRVRGLEHETVRQFLGIPYATPPLGDLRWRPPIPPPAWKNTLDAFELGNVCAQHKDCLPGFSLDGTTEDCLYLNVYTPSSSAQPVNQRRPVMVWIHGGGMATGASSQYDPTKLVREGDVVIVSLNYRLSIFGFFSHPAINAEGHKSGNYGIMDQQLALKWVQDNIEAFGGDASNVTIFGESAGGMSVCAHLASPQSAGLFHRAICQSGGHVVTSQFLTLEELEKDGIALAEKAGCRDQTATELRQLSTADAMRANAVPKGMFTLGAYRFGLMEDGIVVPKGLRQKFLTGEINKVPVLIGSTRDEFFWFQGMAEAIKGTSVTEDGYAEAVSNFFTRPAPGKLLSTSIPEDAVDDLLKRYPAVSYDNPSQALAAAIGDSGFVNLAGRRAAQTLRKTIPRVFAYEFDVPDSPSAVWPKASFSYRSCHASEIQYLFPLFPSGPETAHLTRPLSKPQQSLATSMVQYWTTFAKYGTPNGSGDSATTATTPEWDVYDVKKDNVMVLEAPIPRMIVGWGERHHADFWDAHYR